MSNRFATHIRVHCISACLLAVLTPWAGAAEAPRPVPIVGTEAEFSGHLMGADCARWTTAALTRDGVLLRTCQGYTIESSLEHDFIIHEDTNTLSRKESFAVYAVARSCRMASRGYEIEVE